MKCYPDSYFNSNDHATATRQEVIRIIGLSPPPACLNETNSGLSTSSKGHSKKNHK